MSVDNPSALEERCKLLRTELKLWEKQFASQNGGKKAGRDDIKANGAISQKYKEYNKLRDLLSGTAAPQTPSRPSRKRKISEDIERVPKRHDRPNPCMTPLKKPRREENADTDAPGSASKVPSPEGPQFIGPTPQRDGIVLGLFDLIDSETPSKNRGVLQDVVPNIAQTPTNNRRRNFDDDLIATPVRGERTPQSVGKRFLLDKFVTPQKRKRGDPGTPTSSMKEFATPAFLRRDRPLEVIDEDVENSPPRPAPWKPRIMGRSLSAMIKLRKKEEEDRLDEELEIMREMEMEAEGLTMPKKPRELETIVQDSQPAMPLGPDGFGDSSGEEYEAGPNDKPGRVWKKRGQKRQTRRASLRPTIAKRPPQPEPEPPVSDEEVDRVAETQMQPDLVEAGSDDDEDDASDYSDHSHTSKKRKVQSKSSELARPVEPEKNEANVAKKREGESVVRAAARKVKESAHANYRRLKIKSKTATGGKGRFGRRR